MMALRFLTDAGMIALILVTATAGAHDVEKADASELPPPSDKKEVTYETDIRPIFEKTCFKCHGPEKQKGKLRLDSLTRVLNGGEDGAILKKGDSANSSIVHAVARLDEDDAMPPEGKGDALTRDQISLIRAWIDQGAK